MKHYEMPIAQLVYFSAQDNMLEDSSDPDDTGDGGNIKSAFNTAAF